MTNLLNIETNDLIFDFMDEYHQYYEPTDFKVLELVKEYINEDDYVLDFGCGKGRVAFYLHNELGCKIRGIEYAKPIYDIALRNLELYGNNKDISFINTNAEDYEIKEENVFYLFNPFSSNTFQKVLNNILESSNPKRLILFWIMSEYQEILDNTKELELIKEIDCNGLAYFNSSFNKLLIYDIKHF